MENVAPPAYQQTHHDPSHPNTLGPQSYVNPSYIPTGQQQANMQSPMHYMGPPYMPAAPQMQSQPIVIMQQMQQQQQQQQIIVRRRGTSHGLCCLLCFLTGGLSLPCWIYACIVD